MSYKDEENINVVFFFGLVSPPCPGITRGYHISWSTMESMIPTMMMINMSIDGIPKSPLIYL